jgi:cytochrome c551/c552
MHIKIITGMMTGLLLSGVVSAAEMPALAKKHGCTACHDINKRVVGPAWMEVSRKYKGIAKYNYKGQEYELEEGLMAKVSQGGSGNWGSMPMPANDPSGTHQEEFRTLVRFILGLAK